MDSDHVPWDIKEKQQTLEPTERMDDGQTVYVRQMPSISPGLALRRKLCPTTRWMLGSAKWKSVHVVRWTVGLRSYELLCSPRMERPHRSAHQPHTFSLYLSLTTSSLDLIPLVSSFFIILRTTVINA